MQNTSEQSQRTPSSSSQDLDKAKKELLLKKESLLKELKEVNFKLGIDPERPVKEALKAVAGYIIGRSYTEETVYRDIDILYALFESSKDSQTAHQLRVRSIISGGLNNMHQWLNNTSHPLLTSEKFNQIWNDYNTFWRWSEAPTKALVKLVNASQSDAERGEYVRKFMINPDNHARSGFCEKLWLSLNKRELFALPENVQDSKNESKSSSSSVTTKDAVDASTTVKESKHTSNTPSSAFFASSSQLPDLKPDTTNQSSSNTTSQRVGS